MKSRTNNITRHGQGGPTLPAGWIIDVVPADNLPADADIKYWAGPHRDGPPWTPALLDAARTIGVGLYATDVVIFED